MKIEEQAKGRLLKPEEAAERLAVSPNTIKKWLRSGKLPGVKVNVLWRIYEKDLNSFIKYQQEEDT